MVRRMDLEKILVVGLILAVVREENVDKGTSRKNVRLMAYFRRYICKKPKNCYYNEDYYIKKKK